MRVIIICYRVKYFHRVNRDVQLYCNVIWFILNSKEENTLNHREILKGFRFIAFFFKINTTLKLFMTFITLF